MEKEGRIKYRTLSQFPFSMNTLVRRGDHVLILPTMILKRYMAMDFTLTEQCSFYAANEEFLSQMLAIIAQKDSPIIQSISDRIMGMTEAGLFLQWMRMDELNSTACYRAPSTIAVTTILSLDNVWGVFAIPPWWTSH
ncbi:uncharacterized protein [Panulirus ornatus]|uniref:uncharacterized protein n=1 Tax=Panulirus ornatus TaxID=150431 RepID=UPI003A885402